MDDVPSSSTCLKSAALFKQTSTRHFFSEVRGLFRH